MAGKVDGRRNGNGALYAEFMGGFRLTYNARELRLAKSYTEKAMQLLILLVYHGEAGMTREDLLDKLYPEDAADGGNRLKALLFRLRQKLAQCGLPGEQHILYEKGRYRFTKGILVTRDVSEFEELAQSAFHAQGETRRSLLQKACGAYGGELLPQLMTQPWVAGENVRLSKIFNGAAQALYQEELKARAYDSAYSIAKRASMLRPFDEEWPAKTIQSLLLQGKRQQALHEYESATEIFIRIGGTKGTDRFKNQLASILDGAQLPKAEESLKEMLALGPEAGAQFGPYECSYPGFEESVQALSRILERERLPASFLICRLMGEDQAPWKEKSGAKILRAALKSCLRQGDIFAGYGWNQTVALLWDTSKMEADALAAKVENAFVHHANGLEKGVRLLCKALPIVNEPQV